MAEKKSAAATKKATKSAPKKEVKETKAERVEGSKKMNPKMADPVVILQGYDELIQKLAAVEASQKTKNKPYRIYFVHRKRLEVMKINFIKSMR